MHCSGTVLLMTVLPCLPEAQGITLLCIKKLVLLLASRPFISVSLLEAWPRGPKKPGPYIGEDQNDLLNFGPPWVGLWSVSRWVSTFWIGPPDPCGPNDILLLADRNPKLPQSSPWMSDCFCVTEVTFNSTCIEIDNLFFFYLFGKKDNSVDAVRHVNPITFFEKSLI